MDSDLSDEALAVAAREGDRDAGRQLVERYSTPLYNYAYRMMGNAQDARELSQEALLRALKNLHRFDARQRFSSWVFRITRNASIDRIRRRRPTVEQDEQRTADMSEKGTSGLGVSPESRAQQTHEAEILHRCLRELRPAYREIITLYHFNGLAYAEIASTLGIPMGTVMNRLWRARRALAAAVSKEGITR